ncbi:hypothetical protein P152DRAFT_215462 [Eremomyces bilateralis CBS 781.70]|uniref:Zn(2)-C6 fungal-type domain-containing protein n=1 Tax=Eremomyces bilateralis CBS 781.70 TaxID=1392243 RepID=A0A6G1FS15_9PEZI|nr:uncharacterized protein P152DRAFT_215462 [Eremomyces bilateralis CBS 781.70]KAF1808645.1 hypothetical protein P152DRAFT_215462 [Eremomyces bilateralis CBS 781.70]
MSTPQRQPSMSADEENGRKRVGKACDRCRLKKSKCDGATPCSRCKADNAICVFGERKRVHDKVYPKGYVEMLEQQQAQLVAGLRELYHRLQPGCERQAWPGAPLETQENGHPLTHDILERLDLLYLRIEGGPIPDGTFEDDPAKLQQKMVRNGSRLVKRRGSVSSDSSHDVSPSTSTFDTPPTTNLSYNDHYSGMPPTPPAVHRSPFMRQTELPAKKMRGAQFGMPLHQPQVAIHTAVMNNAPAIRNSLMNQTMEEDSELFAQMDSSIYDGAALMAPFNGFGIPAPTTMAMDWSDPSADLDFGSFIQAGRGTV